MTSLLEEPMRFCKKKKKEKFFTNNKKLPLCAFDTCSTIVFLFVVVILVFTFVVRDVSVSGISMNDTLMQDDKLILTNFNYTPKPNDIVAINAEDKIDKIIIKRVIATEGQTIKIDYDTGNVIVDGIILDEDYTSSLTQKPSEKEYWDIPYVVPEGCIFVLGDNRGASLDSRSKRLEFISEENVLGKAQFIVFPFDRFSYLY